jgi:hypothetical protein
LPVPLRASTEPPIARGKHLDGLVGREKKLWSEIETLVSSKLPPGAPRLLADGPAIFQVRIALLDIEPAIWRRVLVPADTTLDQLHEVIQAVFGWWNNHLHQHLIAPG